MRKGMSREMRMSENMKGRNAAVLLWAILCILARVRYTVSQQTTTTVVPEDVTPYVLFTTQFGVHRIWLDDDSGTVENLVVGSFGYGPLDYHYERDLLFWINELFHCIIQARLSDGSSVTVLIDEETIDPADLTVDWINDKLYWVDAVLCEIWEFDLMTNATRLILTTGTAQTSYPRGIVIYPYLDNGWLYWTDQTPGSLMMGSVHGDTMEALLTDLPCLQTLTIDYETHTLFWAETCEYAFQSISLDGDRTTFSYPFTQNVFFVSAMAQFKDNLFWVEPTGIFTIKRSGEGYRAVMRSSSTERPHGMQVVHPSHQPAVEDYVDIILEGADEYECTPPCTSGLGTCIPPGFCACDKGWKGVTCDVDIDECDINIDGCEHICTNYNGSYNCSCYSGYTLNLDWKTCDDIDECANGTVGCEHTCTNYAGGYNCSCHSGYTLDADLKNCSDIDECANGTDGCEHTCTNYAGGYNCSCHSGYTLNPDLNTCDATTIPADIGSGSGELLMTNISPTTADILETSRAVTHSLSIVASSLRTVALNSSKLSLKMSAMTRSLSPELISTNVHLSMTSILSLSQMSLTQTSITHTSVTPSSAVTSKLQLTTLFSSSSHHTPHPSTPLYSTVLSSLVSSSRRLISKSPPTSTHTAMTTPSATLSPVISTLISSATSTKLSSSTVTISPSQTMLLHRTTVVLSTANSGESSLASLMPSSSLMSLALTSSRKVEKSSSDVMITSLVSVYGTEIQPSSAVTVFHHSTESIVTSENIRNVNSTRSSVMISTTTSIKEPLKSFTTTASEHQATLIPSIAEVAEAEGLKWFEEYKLAIIVIVVGVAPASIALLVLVVILLYRSYANSGSWSPNMESIDELPQQHAIIDTVDDEFVTLSSFKMCKR